VALRNVEIIEREGLVERVRDHAGPLLARGLATLASKPLVGEVRSVGLLGAVEIVAEKGTNRRVVGGKAAQMVRDACIARGLMVRAVRESIVMSPPFVITDAEIARLISILGAALEEVADQLDDGTAAARLAEDALPPA